LICTNDNLPSQRVASNNGMRFLKETEYHSMQVRIYRITKEEWEKENFNS
jgi:RimJ/RimL family protein N-acetyltransferase